MRYMKVEWVHHFEDEPVLLYSEIIDGVETRKVEVYRDGHLDFADESRQSGTTRLGVGLMPTVEELSADPEFKPCQIDRAEFEKIWCRAANRASQD